MTALALVHGAHHGGWCWQRVAADLVGRGFDVVAPDLPCDDAGAGLADYAEVVEKAVASHDDVVLVGHSLASLVIPLVASHRPVRRMVFLCSVPTGPGPAVATEIDTMVTAEWLAAARFHDASGRELLTNQDARALFFHDCTDEVASWAVARLRPQGQRPLTEASPLTAWPDTPQSVVLCTGDRVLRHAWAMDASRARLGGDEPILLPGSHSPFLSRPGVLAEVLAGLAA